MHYSIFDYLPAYTNYPSTYSTYTQTLVGSNGFFFFVFVGGHSFLLQLLSPDCTQQ